MERADQGASRPERVDSPLGRPGGEAVAAQTDAGAGVPASPPAGVPADQGAGVGPDPTRPVAVDTARIVLVGLACWAVALVVVLAVPSLHTGARDWWPWTCLAGLVLGLMGLAYVRRGRGSAAGARPRG